MKKRSIKIDHADWLLGHEFGGRSTKRSAEKTNPDKPIRENKYYFIWIEGLEPKTGEKVKSFRYSPERGHYIEYTTRMMDAMRITKDKFPVVTDLLKDCHVADWVLRGRVFVSTSYCPKNMLWNGEISE